MDAGYSARARPATGAEGGIALDLTLVLDVPAAIAAALRADRGQLGALTAQAAAAAAILAVWRAH